MKLVEVQDGERGIDCDVPLTWGLLDIVQASGATFVGRYLGDVTPEERDRILARHLKLFFVSHAHYAQSWIPSIALGTTDGTRMAVEATKLELPAGTPLGLDAEGPKPGFTADTMIAYLNAGFAAVEISGFESMLYEGYALALTASQLYHRLTTKRYWRSCSLSVPTPAVRGYQLVQEAPGDVWLPPGSKSLRVDWNTARADALGSRMRMLVADDFPEVQPADTDVVA
jgi:hypothetical protein